MSSTPDQLKELADVLIADTMGCAELLEADRGSQVLRRAFVRAVFASIEGFVYLLKQRALESHNRQIRFSRSELSLLKEEAFSLSGGKVQVTKAKLRLSDNVKFAFRLMAQSGFSSYPLDTESVGWNQFIEAVKVRDRLMHPKVPSDFTVTDLELAQTEAASLWFLNNVGALFDSLSTAMRESLDLLREATPFAESWFKLIQDGNVQDTFQSLLLEQTRVKTLDEWKAEVERINREFGSPIFRTLVFKIRLVDESEPTFLLKSYGVYMLNGQCSLVTEDLTLTRQKNGSWRVTAIQITKAGPDSLFEQS